MKRSQQAALTAAERRAKYKKAHGLSAIFLSQPTRERLKSMRLRAGLTAEAVIDKALALLAADWDRADHPKLGHRKPRRSAPGPIDPATQPRKNAKQTIAPSRKAQPRPAANQRRSSSLRDGSAAEANSGSSDAKASRTKFSRSKHAQQRGPDMADLFEGLLRKSD
jgi:hypothetical protein